MAKLQERRTSWNQLFRWITLALLVGNVGADWTATCSHGCNCKWADGKKVAECVSAGFSTIPENLSPEIQVLDLRGNNLGVLVDRAFSSAGLMNLQRIYLRNCSLHTVQKEAFHDLNIMIEVDLSYNQLTRLAPETFSSNGKLRFLYLNGNPLQKLEAHQFPGLPHLRTLELINCNLEALDKKSFMHLDTLETLKLSDNRLANLKPEVFLPLGRLKSLSLEGNPWMCDCRLLPLRDYLSEANLNSPEALCAGPPNLIKQSWSRLAKEDFACKPVVLLIETAVEGRPGFDATFSCRVTGSPPPTITWILQNRQVVNASIASSQSDHFIISQGPAPLPVPASPPPGHVPHEEADRIVWSNLTLRRIGDQDAGEYRCVAENKGGRVEANVTLLTPPSPVIVIMEEETGVPYTVVIGVAAVVALLLLLSLLMLTVCLCRRHKKRGRRSAANVKQNGSHHKNSNGTNGSIPAGRDPDQEKSLLEMELDVRESGSQKVCAIKSDGTGGYAPVSQSDVDTSGMMTMMTMGRVRGSLTYIPGEKYDDRVPDPAVTRLLMANGAPATGINQIRDLSTGSPIQLTDGSFYPDLLDIPHRARGGGSPSGSGMSALSGSTVPDTSRLVMPLNPAHLAGHPSYHTSSDYRIVPAAMQPMALHPPLQFTDSNSTSSGAVMVVAAAAGARPGYVTLPRRPRPRMPSWSSNTPVAASPAPSVDRPLQPIYDTIGPRITADGSSSSALSLNKIAGLTPDQRVASPTQSLTGHVRPLSTTLDRVHKMSLPAYYVPIEEVDVPASPMTGAHRFSARSATLPKSTPNISEVAGPLHPADQLANYVDGARIINSNQQPVLPQHFSSPARSNAYGDDDPSPPTTSTPNSNTSYTSPEVLSPIPDFRSAPPGSRASVSSVGSAASRASGVVNGAAGASGVRRKIPPAVAPKPVAGSKTRPLNSVQPAQTVNGHQPDSLGDPLELSNGSEKDTQSPVPSPMKVPPKPPPKPKKRLSLAESVGTEAGGRVPDEDGAVYEDEGEDGTEV